jgi:Flp pilus assembly protein CpaB
MNKYQKYLKEKRTNKVLLLILILFAISLTSVEIYRVFFSDYYYEEVLNYIEVPVLNKDLSQRDLISKKDIDIIKLPSEFINEDIILDKKLLVDQYVKLGNNINSFTLISKNQLENTGKMNGYGSTLLNKNQSLFSITTNLSKTSGNSLNESMNVDIYLTIEKDKNFLCDKILENVRIVSIKDSDGNAINSSNTNLIPYIIVMAINEEYIPIMNIALKVGELDLYINNDCYEYGQESILNLDSNIMNYLE